MHIPLIDVDNAKSNIHETLAIDDLFKGQTSADRTKRRSTNMKALIKLKAKGYKVVCMHELYQYRINRVLDIYTTNNKYHYLPKDKRGKYDTVDEIVKKYVK